MIRFSVCCAFLVLAVCIPSFAQTTNPWEQPMDTIVNYGSYMVRMDSRGGAFGKDIPYANFTNIGPFGRAGTILGSGTLQFDVGLSCNGINAESVLGNTVGQYERVVRNLQEMLPIMLIYHLMYNMPTLTHYLNELEGSFEYSLGLANMSCSDAKSLASQDWFKNSESIGKAKCESENGGDVLACTTQSNQAAEDARVEAFDKAKSELTKWLDKIDNLPPEVFTSQNITYQSVSLTKLQRVVSTDCYEDIIAQSGGNTINYTLAVLALGGFDCNLMETVGSLLPSFQQSRQDGAKLEISNSFDTSGSNSRGSVRGLYLRYSEEFLNLISEAVASTPAPGARYAPEDQAMAEAYNEKVGEIASRAQMPVPQKYFAQLRSFRGSDPERYSWVKAEMASQFAEAQITSELYFMKSSIKYGSASQAVEKIPESVIEGLNDGIVAIFAELEETQIMREMSSKFNAQQRIGLQLDPVGG